MAKSKRCKLEKFSIDFDTQAQRDAINQISKKFFQMDY